MARHQQSRPVPGVGGQSGAWDVTASIGGQVSASLGTFQEKAVLSRAGMTCAVSRGTWGLGDVSAVRPQEELGSHGPCPLPRSLRPDLLGCPKVPWGKGCAYRIHLQLQAEEEPLEREQLDHPAKPS